MVNLMNDKDFEPCPLCNGLKARILFSTKTPISEFHLVQCKICELTRTLPLPSDDSLNVNGIFNQHGRGVNKFIPTVQKIRNELKRLRAKYCLSLIPYSVQTPKILDVGCAEGSLLNAFQRYGCQCWGVEHPLYPSQRFLNSDRIAYFQGDFQDISLPEGQFDLIILWHVLEHMGSPRLIMGRLYRLLAPDGIIIVAVPNFSSLEARRLKQAWFHLDVPWHKYHYNDRSLGYLMKKSRLRIIRRSTLCFEQGPYGLIQSVLNAMGWLKNEFYEALKGNLTHGRSIHLIIQFFMVIFLLVPGFLVSLFTSIMGKGPVLRMISKKERFKDVSSP